jgi:hypothetical protein
MKKLVASRAILALVLSVTATALGQDVVLGVLEDSHGWYAGEPNFRSVRVVFRKVGRDWKPFPSNCPDERCLKTIATSYPREMTWTITFDGKNLGQITSHAPSEFKWYAAIGQQEIAGAGYVPTVGKRSSEFGGYAEAAVYRPLVANSQPYFKDAEEWKPIRPSQDLISALRQAFRRQFPKLCRLGGREQSRMDAFPYHDQDVEVVKAYASKLGRTIARLHLLAVDCADVEAGFDIDDPWFVVESGKSGKYLDSGMWLVDAGDYDDDGRSELVFSIDRENRGGYLLFYDDFKKHTAFEYSYH